MRAAIVILGGCQAWSERYGISPDGVSYLNLSDGWATGDLSAGLSTYWSPVYPALLGIARALVNPSPANEATLLHALNFVFLVASLVGVEMFLSELRARAPAIDASGARNTPGRASLWWDVFNYSLFGWGALELISVGSSTPDMIVYALFFFGAALTLRCHRAPTPGAFAALGFVLGMGFLAKGALLTVGAIWLAIVAAGFGIRANWRQRLLAPALFVAVSLPLVAALSLEKGRLTLGDAGRVNRGWYVNRYPMIWTGEPPGSGKPVHPPVVAHENPLVIEYPDGAGKSYPFFDDPSYWTEGMTPHADLRGQVRTTLKQLRYYWFSIGPLVLAVALLSLKARPRTVVLRELGAVPSLSISMLVLIAGYATIVTQTRFIAGSAVILTMLGFDAFRRAARPPPTPILATIAATLSLVLVSNSADVVHQSLMVVREARGTHVPNDHFAVATALSKAGLKPGDKVAVVGSAMQSYWARLAGVRIAAEVPPYARKNYWGGTDSVRSAVDAAFWRSGARAIIASGRSVRGDVPGWEPLPANGYFVSWPADP
jgi:hypothetical protein